MEVDLKDREGMDWAEVCDDRFQLGTQEKYAPLPSCTRRGSYADHLNHSQVLYRQEEWLYVHTLILAQIG